MATRYDDDTLLKYRYGTLESDEAEAIAEAMRTDAELMQRYAALCAGIDRLAVYDAEAELDDGLADRVLQRVRDRRAEEERAAAEQARQEAEAGAERARQAAADAQLAPTMLQTREEALAQVGARALTPAAEERREEEEPRLGFWQWIGLQAGAPLRLARLAAALATVVGTLYVAGGAAYYGTREIAIDTQVSGDEQLRPGTRGFVGVKVMNMKTLRPLPAAQVKAALVGAGKRWELFAGTTSAAGTADVSFELPEVDRGKPYTLEVIAEAAGERDVVRRQVRFHRSFRVHLSTDKPLYQPGQTIHIRSLVLGRGRLRPAAGEKITLETFDPKGVRISRELVPVSKYGVAAHGLELADDIRLGQYRIKATIGGHVRETKVKVSRYTLPKFKIAVEPTKPFFLAGETMRANVSARYFFGKVVSRGDVRAVLFKGDGQVLGDEIKAKTDARGHYQLTAELPATLAAPGKPETVMLEVEIGDTAGQKQRKQIPISVARELLVMRVVPEGGKLLPGLENTLYVLTTTPNDQPVAAQVKVRTPEGKALAVKTHANGIGAFRYTPAGLPKAAEPRRPVHRRIKRGRRIGRRPGRWRRRRGRIRRPPPPRHGGVSLNQLSFDLEGEDSAGRRATVKVGVPRGKGAMMISTDAAFYQPGQTARLRLQAPADRRLAVVEGIQHGQTVLRKRVPLKSGRAEATIDLPRALRGTVQIDFYTTDRFDVRKGPVSRQIVVADSEGLKVRMRAEKPSFRPGAPAKLRFEVTDAKGAPTPAAIGLSVVDESLYALAKGRPEMARAFFLLERSLLKPKLNLSLGKTVSVAGWGAAEQLVGRLLLSLAPTQKRPHRFKKETFDGKVAELSGARKAFEDKAYLVGIAVALVLALVLVVFAARRLPAWAGALMVAIGGVVALLIELPLTWVAIGCGALALAGLAAFGERHRRFAWHYLALPALALVVGAVVAGTFERRSPHVGAVATSEAPAPTATTGEGETTSGKHAQRPQGAPEPAREAAPPARRRTRRRVRARKKGRRGAAAGALFGRGGIGNAPARGGRAKDEEKRAATKSPSAGRAIPRRKVRVRRYFPETMYVHPELVTDERGVAELTIPLADSITAWRVQALASAADGRLGALTQPLKVFQDFFVDLDLPVGLVRGDEATLAVAVYNYLDKPQDVRLEVTRQPWFELVGPAKRTVKLGPGAVGGVELRLRVLEAGPHRLTVRADGTRLSDAVSRELTVAEAGQQRSAAVSGVLVPGETAKVAVKVPEAAVKGSAKVLVKLYPSRLASALDGLQNAVRMPTGCFEQTSSANYPNVLIYDYLKRAKKLTPAFRKRVRRLIGLGYQRLLRYEVSGGGFEWFGRRPANRVLTVYGLMQFADMKQVMAVDNALMRRTRLFLLRGQNSDGSWSPDARSLNDGLWRQGFKGKQMTTAYIAWALAESRFVSGGVKRAIGRALGYLERELSRIDDPYTLSAMLAAAAITKHRSAGQVRQQLAALAQRTKDKRAFFRPAGATLYHSRGRGAIVETTALAAYALARAGGNPDLTRKAVDYLAASRDPRGTWYSTQGTILALRALLFATTQEQDSEVKLLVNGQDAGSHKLEVTSDKPQLIDLGARARAGANVVELTGSARSTFQVITTYTLPWRDKHADEDQPLALKVTYGRTRVDVGGIVPVDVQLTYRKPSSSGMVLVSLGVPAGLTPLTADLQQLKRAGTVARYELAGGKLNFYLDRIRNGQTVRFGVRLKARSKVRTKGAASVAYLYYHPEIRANAAPTALAVR